MKCRCIVSKHYSAALPALDQEFDDVDPKTTGMTARHFLLFCYYGGMIYTGDPHLHLEPAPACLAEAHSERACHTMRSEEPPAEAQAARMVLCFSQEVSILCSDGAGNAGI